jgi:hypothetical protein
VSCNTGYCRSRTGACTLLRNHFSSRHAEAISITAIIWYDRCGDAVGPATSSHTPTHVFGQSRAQTNARPYKPAYYRRLSGEPRACSCRGNAATQASLVSPSLNQQSRPPMPPCVSQGPDLRDTINRIQYMTPVCRGESLPVLLRRFENRTCTCSSRLPSLPSLPIHLCPSIL